jgi:beta-N-acetylhexosaminidase
VVPRRRLGGFLAAVVLGAALAAAGWQARSVDGELAAHHPTTQARQADIPVAPVAPTPPPPAPPSCADVIAGWTPRQRLAQLLMVGVDPSRTDPALELAGPVGIGGIFVGGNDITLLVDNRLAAVHAAAAVPLAVSVDEEGGRVQRVDLLDGPVPSARVMATTMTVDQVRVLARARGGALRARGVTIDFAPVVDVSAQADGDVIGDRSFSSDPATVTRYASAFADGLSDSGVLAVVKHFPGHGRASGDSHRATVTTPALAELRDVDLVPYRQLLAASPVAVMVGHMVVPGLTDGLPATLSPATYRLLRDELGFHGLTITDDLGGMRAVSNRYPLPEAVLTALVAGVDIAFWSSGERIGEVLDVLEGALADQRLPAERVTEALGNVLRAKAVCPA